MTDLQWENLSYDQRFKLLCTRGGVNSDTVCELAAKQSYVFQLPSWLQHIVAKLPEAK